VNLHIRTNYNGVAMANQKHLTQLRKGIEQWNIWRKAHRRISPDLSWAHLDGADLSRANMNGAYLVGTHFEDANLDDCWIYGISAWDVHLDGARQTNLRITPPEESEISVDNLQVAQLLYLILHNEEFRTVIDTLSSKVVLLLGRFSPDRKAVLDGLRDGLRACGYVPVLVDFANPTSKSTSETVILLARMARFVVADLTDPASIPP
jgi:Pentapeptide repeats (8 copies)